MLTITKEFQFDAAHKLWRSTLSEKENYALYGNCSRLHGHTYRLQVTVTGPVGPDGMIINFCRLKEIVHTLILHRYDHAFLNDLDEYADVPVTAENMTRHIFHTLDPVLEAHQITLWSIVLYETPTSWATLTRNTMGTDSNA